MPVIRTARSCVGTGLQLGRLVCRRVGRIRYAPFVTNRCRRLGGGGFGSTWHGWSDGVAVGGHIIGFNWQYGSFVYGLEADGSWLSNKETEFNSWDTHRWKMNWLATFRARAGLAVDRTLLYLTYGLAVAKPKNHWCSGFGGSDCDDGFASTSKTRVGRVVGAGIEYAPVSWANWSIRSEFLYASLRRQKTQVL